MGGWEVKPQMLREGVQIPLGTCMYVVLLCVISGISRALQLIIVQG
jgi:hypothetical protein